MSDESLVKRLSSVSCERSHSFNVRSWLAVTTNGVISRLLRANLTHPTLSAWPSQMPRHVQLSRPSSTRAQMRAVWSLEPDTSHLLSGLASRLSTMSACPSTSDTSWSWVSSLYMRSWLLFDATARNFCCSSSVMSTISSLYPTSWCVWTSWGSVSDDAWSAKNAKSCVADTVTMACDSDDTSASISPRSSSSSLSSSSSSTPSLPPPPCSWPPPCALSPRCVAETHPAPESVSRVYSCRVTSLPDDTSHTRKMPLDPAVANHRVPGKNLSASMRS